MAHVINTYILKEEDTNYTLPEYDLSNIEIIDESTVFLPLNVIGNAKANNIKGNAQSNLLNGGGGQDTLAGGQGDDTYIVGHSSAVVIEDANGGLDNINASVSYVLSANVENLTLTGLNDIMSTDHINGTGNALSNIINGNAGNNYLSGLDGNDVLNGGMGGNDTLNGGNGDDVYYINGANDVVIEGANGGRDTAWVNVDNFDVSKLKNIEVVKFTKNAPAPTDMYAGPLGPDGKPPVSEDTFIFSSKLSKKTPVVKIADFNVKNDTICLSKSVFKKISKTGDLSKSAFYKGVKAHDANDRIVYNKKTGYLSYDKDGSGAAKAIKFAKLDKKLKVTADDFFVI